MSSVSDLLGGPVGGPEEFVFPRDLFETPQDAPAPLWTCVRTRPRWEKKLSGFLRFSRIPYYLPVTIRQTYSGRKLRTASIPFFPGFVFVKGGHTKQSLKNSACVTNILKPASQMHHKVLDEQIRAIHRLLAQAGQAELITQYQVGQRVTVASGPLQGVSGTIVASANANQLVVWVDMLGVGASMRVGRETRLMVG